MIEYITLRIAEEILQDKKIEGKFVCRENQFYYAIVSKGGKTDLEKFDDKQLAENWLNAR